MACSCKCCCGCCCDGETGEQKLERQCTSPKEFQGKGTICDVCCDLGEIREDIDSEEDCPGTWVVNGRCQDEPCGAPPPSECCNEDGSCTLFCPGISCTPADGVCCDAACIECGDCGVGGEECCNSVEIASLFAPLTDQPEVIEASTADQEIAAYSRPEVTAAWIAWSAERKNGGVYKFSILWRSYLLDALEAIEAGEDAAVAMQRSLQQWKDFANKYRGVING